MSKISNEDLRLRRLALRQSQQEVAEKVGVHQTTISQIERGLPPTKEQEKKIRAALGLPEDD